MSNITQVYIDLDGVLANCVSQLEIYLGKIYTPILGEYDFTKTFDISRNELMRTFDDHDFWATMPHYPWLNQLVEYFESFGVFITFVTHAVDSLHSFTGKYEWFVRYLSKYKDDLVFIRAPKRHLLAAPGRVLIDDNDQNVAAWVLNGGEAILFPQTWNANHEYSHQPLRYMMTQFERMTG